MNREEATKFLALIKVAYPKAYRNMDNDSLIATVNMWHSTFSDTPYPIMEIALDHFRKTSEFEPTVAGIYKELKNLHYAALGDVLTSNEETKVNLGRYIMQHTSRFKDENAGRYEINYKSLIKKFKSTDVKLLEGGQADGN